MTRSKENKVLLVLVALPFIYLGFTILYPIGSAIILSFTNYNPIFMRKEFIGLGNYITFFTERPIMFALGRTLLYTGICVGASFVLGFLFALLTIAVDNRISTVGSKILQIAIVLPMLLVPAGGAVLWHFAFTTSYGWVNFLLPLLGIEATPWLATKYSMFFVMVADIWGWTPFVYLILLAGLYGLPSEPIEAARIDGASRFQLLTQVVVPLMKPIIMIALILKTIDTYKAFDYLWVMTKGGPGKASTTLSIEMYETAFRLFDFGKSAGMGIMNLFIPLLLIVLFWTTGKVWER